MIKEKKSFKKFAKKHLADVIKTRRKTATGRKEKKERLKKKQIREKKATQDEEKDHVDQLNRLEELDPSFHAYLEEEDPTLLDFAEEGLDHISGSNTETDSDKDENEETAKEEFERVTEIVLKDAIEKKKFNVMLFIFLSAVKELGFDYSKQAANIKLYKFQEPTLVKKSLQKIAACFGANVGLLVKSGSFRSAKARYLIRRFLSSLVIVIIQGSTDKNLTAGLFRSLHSFVPVLHVIKGLTKSVLKTALSHCTSEDEVLRLSSYVIVRAIAVRSTNTQTLYQSAAFKGIFLALIRTTHNYNIHTLPIIGHLMSCVVDLYGTDMEAAYQHMFTNIRQLALYLRNALQKQTQPNLKAVFNWQYLNALRTCGLVVSSYPTASQLGPLIYPVIQLTLGVMDLFSSPRMFPAHLILIEMLNHISSRVNGLYIPLSSYILRVLTASSNDISEKRSRDTGKGEEVDLQFMMRVKKSQARTYNYRVSIWKEALFHLTEHLAIHSCNIGFPECFWVVETTLRKLKSTVKITQINNMISTILIHFENTNKLILTKRENVDIRPCDTVNVKIFEDELRTSGTRLMQYYATLRQNRIKQFADNQKNLKENVILENVEETLKQQKKRKVSVV